MQQLYKNEMTYFGNEACRSALSELVGRTAPIRKTTYSIAETKLEVGGTVARHYHMVSDEVYIFTKGKCTMRINGQVIQGEAGDIFVIEPGDRHEILPVQEQTEFYAISFPPYSPEDYLTEKAEK